MHAQIHFTHVRRTRTVLGAYISRLFIRVGKTRQGSKFKYLFPEVRRRDEQGRDRRRERESEFFKVYVTEVPSTWPQNPLLSTTSSDRGRTKQDASVPPAEQPAASQYVCRRTHKTASDDRRGCWLTWVLHLAWCAHANKHAGEYTVEWAVITPSNADAHCAHSNKTHPTLKMPSSCCYQPHTVMDVCF